MPSPPGDGPPSFNYRYEIYDLDDGNGPQGFFVVGFTGTEYLFKTLADLNNNNAYAYAE
jgi:hypothetical protein